MRRFNWRGAAQEEEQQPQPSPSDAAGESSPARSYRSTNSSNRGGSSRAAKSREHSPSRTVGGVASGAGGGGDGGGGGLASASNRKTLKIGANVRFRGDVMECHSVVLCGRLQVCTNTFFSFVFVLCLVCVVLCCVVFTAVCCVVSFCVCLCFCVWNHECIFVRSFFCIRPYNFGIYLIIIIIICTFGRR